MGSFTQTLLNVLLSWLKTAISWIWGIIGSPGTQEGLQWFGRYWFVIVAVLIVAGVVMDYLIWFIRWRPFYVWISGWRRIRARLTGRNEAYAPEYPAYSAPQAPVYDAAGYDANAYPDSAYEDSAYDDPAYDEDAYQPNIPDPRSWNPPQETAYPSDPGYGADRRRAPEPGYTDDRRYAQTPYYPAEQYPAGQYPAGQYPA